MKGRRWEEGVHVFVCVLCVYTQYTHKYMHTLYAAQRLIIMFCMAQVSMIIGALLHINEVIGCKASTSKKVNLADLH